jgi:hypothetical protein
MQLGEERPPAEGEGDPDRGEREAFRQIGANAPRWHCLTLFCGVC